MAEISSARAFFAVLLLLFGRAGERPRGTGREVDNAVRELLQDAEARAEEVISSHRTQIERLAADLEVQETLHRHEVDACLRRESSDDKEVVNITRITQS